MAKDHGNQIKTTTLTKPFATKATVKRSRRALPMRKPIANKPLLKMVEKAKNTRIALKRNCIKRPRKSALKVALT